MKVEKGCCNLRPDLEYNVILEKLTEDGPGRDSGINVGGSIQGIKADHVMPCRHHRAGHALIQVKHYKVSACAQIVYPACEGQPYSLEETFIRRQLNQVRLYQGCLWGFPMGGTTKDIVFDC